MKAAVVFDFFGPYHWARLNAAGVQGQVYGVELFGANVEYPWGRFSGSKVIQHFNLFPQGSRQRTPREQVCRKIMGLFDQIEPDVVFLPGWSDYWALTALQWCVQKGVPAVVMSESTADDKSRRGWKEMIKRSIVSLCSAGLVGGRRHKEYLQTLGMHETRIFTGYDAVDNSYFCDRAAAAERQESLIRSALRLDKRFILASSRFVAKKNIFRLLDAYAAYRQRAQEQACNLVLLGGGQLQEQVVAHCAELNLSQFVILPGFLQYDELPSYYGLAEFFVHASTSEQWGLVVNEAMAAGLPVLISERCGCVPDLVHSGRNGFSFDPFNTSQLTDYLLQMSQSVDELAKMGQESQRIISEWSPLNFAHSFWRAGQTALTAGLPRSGVLKYLLLRLMTQRR